MNGNCFHAGCKSGNNGSKCHLFRLSIRASNETRKSWIQNIPKRQGVEWDFKKHRLCHLHFEDKLIIKEVVVKMNGVVIASEPRNWTLTLDAVPTIFSNHKVHKTRIKRSNQISQMIDNISDDEYGNNSVGVERQDQDMRDDDDLDQINKTNKIVSTRTEYDEMTDQYNTYVEQEVDQNNFDNENYAEELQDFNQAEIKIEDTDIDNFVIEDQDQFNSEYPPDPSYELNAEVNDQIVVFDNGTSSAYIGPSKRHYTIKKQNSHQTFTCEFSKCNKKFPTHLTMRIHKQEVHQKLEFQNCPKCKCGLRFKQAYFETHIKICPALLNEPPPILSARIKSTTGPKSKSTPQPRVNQQQKINTYNVKVKPAKVVGQSTNEQFECKFCNKTLSSEPAFIHHNNYFHTNRYNCKYCNIKIVIVKKLEKHQTICKRYAAHCKKCVKSFRSEAIKQNHVCDTKKLISQMKYEEHLSKIESQPMDNFKCEFCPMGIPNLAAKKNHYNHCLSDRYKCKFCGVKASNVELHMESCRYRDKISCTTCSLDFTSDSAYFYHQRVKHDLYYDVKKFSFTHKPPQKPIVKNFKCSFKSCGRSFATEDGLTRHFDYAHTDTFLCSLCNKKYAELDLHKKSCPLKNKVLCSICHRLIREDNVFMHQVNSHRPNFDPVGVPQIPNEKTLRDRSLLKVKRYEEPVDSTKYEKNVDLIPCPVQNCRKKHSKGFIKMHLCKMHGWSNVVSVKKRAGVRNVKKRVIIKPSEMSIIYDANQKLIREMTSEDNGQVVNHFGISLIPGLYSEYPFKCDHTPCLRTFKLENMCQRHMENCLFNPSLSLSAMKSSRSTAAVIANNVNKNENQRYGPPYFPDDF